MKYASLLLALEEDELYTPGSVAHFADKYGYITAYDPQRRREELQRIRIAMGRYSNNQSFPDEGDGMVYIPGQAPTPGWFGWRWKRNLKK